MQQWLLYFPVGCLWWCWWLWRQLRWVVLWYVLTFIPKRKRFPCFHRVMLAWMKFGRTRHAVSGAERRVFPQQFRVLPNFHEWYHNTGKTFLLFFYEIEAQSNYPCFHRVIIVNGFEPIRACIVSCLFHKILIIIIKCMPSPLCFPTQQFK